MREKLLESALLIFFLTLWFSSWLNKAYWLELVSLLGIVGVGYAFKSSLRWKLTIGGFVLALSLPIVTLTLGKTWYWVTVFMVLPAYYLGSLARLARKPFKSLVISALMLVPFVIPRLNFYTWTAIALYWLILGLVGGRVHSSYLEVLVPPLVIYTLSLVMAVTPTVAETQLLKVASLIVPVPVYPIGVWITMGLKGNKKQLHST
ncbi:hypothetical protein [Thermococcus sp.]